MLDKHCKNSIKYVKFNKKGKTISMEDKKQLVIAISGMPGAGKTSLSMNLLKLIPQMVYFDFGEVYRTLTYYLLKVKEVSQDEVKQALSEGGLTKIISFDSIDWAIKDRNCKISINKDFYDYKELHNPAMNKLTVDIGTILGDTVNPVISAIVNKIREDNPVIINARRPFATYKDISKHLFLKADFQKRAERKSILENCTIEEAVDRLKARDQKEESAGFWNIFEFTEVIDTTNTSDEELLKTSLGYINDNSRIHKKEPVLKEH
ncbi:MAG: (d)CMP kinase [Oscillospiraceae bacterium]|nr:(d)CMP kinase [Oscillospiraceae bacterium]